MKCVTCEKEVDPNARTTWQRVIGWERKRKGGGTNAVALRETLQQFMCGECMIQRLEGIDPMQETFVV